VDVGRNAEDVRRAPPVVPTTDARRMTMSYNDDALLEVNNNEDNGAVAGLIAVNVDKSHEIEDSFNKNINVSKSDDDSVTVTKEDNDSLTVTKEDNDSLTITKEDNDTKTITVNKQDNDTKTISVNKQDNDTKTITDSFQDNDTKTITVTKTDTDTKTITDSFQDNDTKTVTVNKQDNDTTTDSFNKTTTDSWNKTTTDSFNKSFTLDKSEAIDVDKLYASHLQGQLFMNPDDVSQNLEGGGVQFNQDQINNIVDNDWLKNPSVNFTADGGGGECCEVYDPCNDPCAEPWEIGDSGFSVDVGTVFVQYASGTNGGAGAQANSNQANVGQDGNGGEAGGASTDASINQSAFNQSIVMGAHLQQNAFDGTLVGHDLSDSL
jgi:hypothetical protein